MLRDIRVSVGNIDVREGTEPPVCPSDQRTAVQYVFRLLDSYSTRAAEQIDVGCTGRPLRHPVLSHAARIGYVVLKDGMLLADPRPDDFAKKSILLVAIVLAEIQTSGDLELLAIPLRRARNGREIWEK
jgi:hypothetical protein